MVEQIWFTEHTAEDGSRSITADRWPEEIAISTALLTSDGLDRRYLQPDEGGVWFIVANGTARYDFTGALYMPGALIARRRTATRVDTPPERNASCPTQP